MGSIPDDDLTGDNGVVALLHHGGVGERADAFVTVAAPRSAEFTECEPVGDVPELFACEYPACGYGGEGGVLVFAGEVGRSVAADYEFGEVAFVVVIVGASEERTHAVVACSAPYFGELFGGGGCVDVGFVHGYDEEVVVVGLEVGVVVGRHGGTDEGANVVKAESLVP